MLYQTGMTLAGTLHVLGCLHRSGLTESACRGALVVGAVGRHSYGGVSYYTQVQNITGLLAPGSEGVNHGACLQVRRAKPELMACMGSFSTSLRWKDIAQDGIVTLLTVSVI